MSEHLLPSITAGLTVRVNELNKKLDVFEERRKTEQKLTRVGLGIVTMMILLTFGVGWSTYLNSKGNRDNGEAIRDCTTPGRSCYEESRQRSRDNVSTLIEANLFIVECVRETKIAEELRSCFEAKLNATKVN